MRPYVRVVAILNQKGGCGKTTTAINLASVLARLDHPTLLVDLDPQSHCAAGLAIPEHRIDQHVGDALLSDPDAPLDATRLLWRITKGLDLLPSTMRLAGLEAARGGLAAVEDRDQRLQSVIRRLAAGPSDQPDASRYEWVVIDCPPSIGLLTYNALRAATEALIPVETSYFAMKGASKQVNTIRMLARRLGGATPYRLLATMHDASHPLAASILNEIGAQFPESMAPVVIRLDQKLREATSLGQPVIEYAPMSTGAQDYARLGTWITANPPARRAAPEHAGIAVFETPMGEADPQTDDENSPSTDAGAAAAHTGLNERPAPADAADPVLSRAAELAARVRQLVHKSETLQTRLASDPNVTPAPDILDEPKPVSPAPASPPISNERASELRSVRFVCDAPAHSRVCVAGDFNGWSPDTHPLRWNEASRCHETTVALPPGKTHYRLVVDGKWLTDERNPDTETNPFGQRNSVVIVRPSSPGMIDPTHAPGGSNA
ncbi:MAG: hypothetical protein EA379_11125 [Phycisphaerales bacterium]|nr:MAG: hypothetical protein EA379_11125 [Phycisphaerales bacterium]